jgi:hypothetical protein
MPVAKATAGMPPRRFFKESGSRIHRHTSGCPDRSHHPRHPANAETGSRGEDKVEPRNWDRQGVNGEHGLIWNDPFLREEDSAILHNFATAGVTASSGYGRKGKAAST